jgi:cobalt-precorrin 5A hydrolase
MSETTTMAVYAVTDGRAAGRAAGDALGGVLYLPNGSTGPCPAGVLRPWGRLWPKTFARYRGIFSCPLRHCRARHRPAPAWQGRGPGGGGGDDTGLFAISLLSGHLGGANDLARTVGGLIGAVPVVTTATDAAEAPAVELLARDLGLALDNAVATRRVNTALASGEPVAVYDPLGFFSLADPGQAKHFEWLAAPVPPGPAKPLVVVDWRLGPETPEKLYLRPSVLVVGVGCRRGAPADAVLELVPAVWEPARPAQNAWACSPPSRPSATSPEFWKRRPLWGWPRDFSPPRNWQACPCRIHRRWSASTWEWKAYARQRR